MDQGYQLVSDLVEIIGKFAAYIRFPSVRERKIVPWTELHSDLIEKIGRQLITTDLADYIRLRAVCKYWRSATPHPGTVYLPPQLPWIMLSFHDEPYFVAPPRLAWLSRITSDDEVNDIQSFLSVSGDTLKVYELSLPFPRPTRIVGTADGWLVVMDVALRVRLFNPLTQEQKRLPQLTPKLFEPGEDVDGDDEGHQDAIGDEGDEDDEENEEPQDRQLQKYLLSKVVILPDNTAVGDVCALNRLVFTRPGKKKWALMDVPFKFTDIISYQGAIYGVDSNGVVARCEIGPPATIMQITPEHGYRDWWYLVEFLGVLLLVAHSATKFEVFKLGQEGKLIEIKSLGDQMLFLNTNRSYCLYASDFPGWEANRIYVTPFSYCLPGRSCIQSDNFIVYNLEDGTFRSLPFNQGPECQTFTWFTPGVY